MRKLILNLIILTAFMSSATAQQNVPKLGKNSIDEVVAAMTLDEKVSLLIGTGMAGLGGNSPVVGQTSNIVPGAAGTTYPIERLGIPPIVLADGPAGLRIQPKREGTEQTFYCTAFPIATLLASTWNTALVEEVGKAMGNEVLEYGADVLLAPGMNLHRNPLNGRNFEYFSEDPLVTGKMAASYVKGIQSNGVGTSIKHFTANNQETNRNANDSRISPRAMRELYLKGFEIAVKEADPWTIMTSYNKLNGVYTSERRDLLTTITRDEWGYKGTIMTDWFGGTDAPAQVHAGNDLLMPGRPDQKTAILNAIKSGKLSVKDVDVNVKRILDLIVKSPRFKGYKYSNTPDLKAHAAVTRQSATEGMILLKNEAATLPLSKKVKKIAAFGNTSYDFIAGGTGSGDVNEAYTVSLGEGLLNGGFKIDPALKSLYEEYIKSEKEKAAAKIDRSNPLSAFLNQARISELIPSESVLAAAVKASDAAIVTIGRNSGEFMDRKVEDDFMLTSAEKELLNKVTQAYHAAGKKVIVVLNIGGVIETASWKDIPDAILLAWQGGQEGGNSVVDILKGVANPSGKLPMSFPIAFTDHPSSATFPIPSDEANKEQMNFFLSGQQNKEKTQRPNVDYTNYFEDIFVGYRAFDKNNTKVSYPFGFGMSYTTFDYSNISVKEENGNFVVSVTVTNSGKVAGKESVQVYVSAPGKDLVKPVKELRAFGKTQLLAPGKAETLSFVIDPKNLASFNEDLSSWVTEAGKYKVLVGASALDIRQSAEFSIAKVWSQKVNDVLRPKLFID